MTKINIEQIHKNHPGLIYKIGFLFAFVAVFTFLALKNPKNSEAASLANFRPGNIISDYTMSNYESMTVAEIDKFLHDHGNCNNRETYKAAWYPSVHYHVKDGHFVCLADEVFAEGVEYGDLIPAGTPSRTAAQVIYDTAHTFKINPQVLLVLLEKEQGLISDSWPNSLQYRSATGFGCPDTAPCNQLYYGFVNQLDNAAYLFRTVLDGGWTNYPLGDNYIYYNPNPACGGSNVYVENLATSSLYRYTPYQPNAAALAAGYGTVSCGAYGNRNFYLFFMDWFGDPTLTVDPIVEAETKFEQPIADGTYQLTSKASPGKVVDIRGGIKEDMTSAELIAYQKNDGATPNQIFEIRYNKTTGYYNLINPASNLYVDVRGGKTDNSTQLIVYSENSSCNQDWLIDTDSDGYATFVSRCSSKVIDVSAKTNKTIIYSRHDGDNQKWKLTPVSAKEPEKTTTLNGEFQISTKDGGRTLDISGGVSEGMIKGNLIVYTIRNENIANQTFKFIYDKAKDAYQIINPASNLRLDVSGSSTTDGASVLVYADNGGYCNQFWKVETVDNNVRLLSSCSNKPLTISNDKNGSNNKLVISTKDSKNENQTWKLIAL